jgi:hypothetical protein
VRQRATVCPRGWISRTPRCPRCVWGVSRLRACSSGGVGQKLSRRSTLPPVSTAPRPTVPLSLVVGAVSPGVQRWEAHHLRWRIAGCSRAAWWEGELISCTGVGKGGEEPCVGGWTRRAGALTVGGRKSGKP